MLKLMVFSKKIDSYLSKKFLKNFFFSSFGLTSLIVLIDLLSSLSRFDASFQDFILYYLYYVPWIFYQVAVFALPLSLLVTLLGMNQNSELVAFRACGYTLRYILSILFFWVISIVIFLFFHGEYIVPKAMEKRNYQYYVVLKKEPWQYSKTKRKNLWYRTQDSIFNIKDRISEKFGLGFSAYFVTQDWELAKTITSESLEVKGDLWLLKNGEQTIIDPDALNTNKEKFNEMLIPALEDFGDFRAELTKSEFLSLRELNSLIKKHRKIGLKTRDFFSQFFQKISFILSGLVLCLLMLPFSIYQNRHKKIYLGVSFSLLSIVSYYAFYNTSLTFTQFGKLPVFLGPFLPLLVFSFIALVLIRKRVR